MRQKVRQQAAAERRKNFNQVSLGLSDEQARAEAKRCLQCKEAKCIAGCPVGIDIPAFIALIVQGKRKEALAKIKEKNNLPAVCGRVCPQEDQCEKTCILNKKDAPINIGALERYAADYELNRPASEHRALSTKYRGKVAVVGSGPAGLTAAADLAKIGYQVLLFESLHIAGGVLSYGIPEFRLPKAIVKTELDYIRHLGVDIQVDVLIGCTFSLDDLFNQGAQAIFLAVGAGLPQFLGIPGENLGRVYSANEFLTRINLMKAYFFPEYATPLDIAGKVAVIGGGNVAFDCARCALRLGKDTELIYRRTEKEMPARGEEIENAKAEGIKFRLLTQPIKILSDEKGSAFALECIKMELAEPDSSGRRRPIAVKGSNFKLGVDTIIIAVGQSPNPLISRHTPGLVDNPDGTIRVDEHLMTSRRGVFAGGDIITGADTVISAMGAGKRAAMEIDQYIKGSPGN